VICRKFSLSRLKTLPELILGKPFANVFCHIGNIIVGLSQFIAGNLKQFQCKIAIVFYKFKHGLTVNQADISILQNFCGCAGTLLGNGRPESHDIPLANRIICSLPSKPVLDLDNTFLNTVEAVDALAFGINNGASFVEIRFLIDRDPIKFFLCQMPEN
jgi:hypothetical protein